MTYSLRLFARCFVLTFIYSDERTDIVLIISAEQKAENKFYLIPCNQTKYTFKSLNLTFVPVSAFCYRLKCISLKFAYKDWRTSRSFQFSFVRKHFQFNLVQKSVRTDSVGGDVWALAVCSTATDTIRLVHNNTNCCEETTIEALVSSVPVHFTPTANIPDHPLFTTLLFGQKGVPWIRGISRRPVTSEAWNRCWFSSDYLYLLLQCHCTFLFFMS